MCSALIKEAEDPPTCSWYPHNHEYLACVVTKASGVGLRGMGTTASEPAPDLVTEGHTGFVSAVRNVIVVAHALKTPWADRKLTERAGVQVRRKLADRGPSEMASRLSEDCVELMRRRRVGGSAR